MSTAVEEVKNLRQQNATVRVHPAPPRHKNFDKRFPPDRPKVKSGLVSVQTRTSRRMNAHLRHVQHIGGKAKHRVFFIKENGKPRLSRRRPLDGRPAFADHAEVGPATPYEARTTAQRPWKLRAKRRARSKCARASRKANR